MEPPLEELEPALLLGALLLGALLLGALLLGEVLEPPEAAPDFEVSLEADPLDDGDEDEEALLEGGDEGELDGDDEDALPELEDPGVDEVRLVSPLSQAARPKASASADASIESFIGPPWVGIQKGRQQIARPA